MSTNPEISTSAEQAYPPVDLARPSRLHVAIKFGRRLVGHAAVAVGLSTGLIAAETASIDPPAAVAETGSYPDWNKPCVAVGDPQYGQTEGSGYWCNNYEWGDSPSQQNSSRGYGYRNCTDWVAFRIPQLVQRNVPLGWHNGENWDNAASAAGYTVDNSPEPGDIAVWEGAYGHVAVVESVNGNGSVNISEYNRGQDGNYDTRNNVTDAGHYIDLNGTGKGINGQDLGAPPDADHDGVIDSEDRCAGVPGIPALHGCPPKDIDRDGIADLVVVNTQNTGSGVTEAHELSGSGGYVNWFGHQATAVNYLDSTQPVLMGDVNADYRPDLVVVNTTNTGSGKVEVHAMDGTTGFSTWIEHAVTSLGYTDATQKFGLADLNNDNRADLLVVNTQNTGSGKVEVHALDAATHYTSWIGHWVTPADYLNLSTQQVLVGDANGDERPDVLIVNTANTGSGLTEVHELNGANGFSTWQAHWVTPVGPLDPAIQRLAMGDANADNIADLFIVNTQNTGSGKVEVHPLSGATHYSAWLGHHIVTPLTSLDPTQKVMIGG